MDSLSDSVSDSSSELSEDSSISIIRRFTFDGMESSELSEPSESLQLFSISDSRLSPPPNSLGNFVANSNSLRC